MCTGMRMVATNGDVVYARNLEFDSPIPTYLGYVPRGQAFHGETPQGDDGLQWTNQHAFCGPMARIELPDRVLDAGEDGMNEHGLTCGLFNLPVYTHLSPVTDDNRSKCIAVWQVPMYILGNYATTAEVRQGVARGDFVVADTPWPFPAGPGLFPLHARVGDRTGETIVLEWLTPDEPPRVFDAVAGTITNAPSYDFHIDNALRYKNLTPYNPYGPVDGKSQDYKLTMGNGYIGLPGGSNPPDRFVRVHQFVTDTYPGDDGASTAWITWHLMNLFDIPPGLMRDVDAATKKETTEYTLWTSVADTANLVYMFRTFTDNAIYEIDMKALDPTGAERLVSTAPSGDVRRAIPAFPAS